MNEPVEGLKDVIFDSYLESKITPAAMTRLVRQARVELSALSDEQAGEILARLLKVWLLG